MDVNVELHLDPKERERREERDQEGSKRLKGEKAMMGQVASDVSSSNLSFKNTFSCRYEKPKVKSK